VDQHRVTSECFQIAEDRFAVFNKIAARWREFDVASFAKKQFCAKRFFRFLMV
jgi:hypothetical protein